MENLPGESTADQHHRGVWLGYKLVLRPREKVRLLADARGSEPNQSRDSEPNQSRDREGADLAVTDLVNGFNFWENEFSYHDPKAGKVVTQSIGEIQSGFAAGSLRAAFRWLSPSGPPILEETRGMVFRGDATSRTIDVRIALKPLTAASFGDAKDGA